MNKDINAKNVYDVDKNTDAKNVYNVDKNIEAEKYYYEDYITEENGLKIASGIITDVQNAINLTKHGGGGEEYSILNIKYFMYNEGKGTKTVIISNIADSQKIIYEIYKRICIKLVDIIDFDSIGNAYINDEKMCLYVISYEDLICSGTSISKLDIPLDDKHKYKLDKISHDIIHKVVRDGAFCIYTIDKMLERSIRNDKVVFCISGDYIEYFKEFLHLFTFFTTSSDKNIKYFGRIATLDLYNRYLYGRDKDVFIGKLLSGIDNQVNNYKTMDKSNTIKKLTENRQLYTLKYAILNKDGIKDDLSSKESKIIMGQI